MTEGLKVERGKCKVESLRFFALLRMTASLCLCTVGAGLVPALCSRGVLFWAPTRDAPTVAVFIRAISPNFLYPSPLRGAPLKQGSSSQSAVFVLGTHKGCPYRRCLLRWCFMFARVYSCNCSPVLGEQSRSD